MVIRGTRTSLARARMIRNARRSRSGKVLSNRSARNTSSRLNRSSRTNQTSDTKQTKQIALYEEVQKAADDMQKTVKALLKLDTVKVDATTKEESTVNADTTAEKTTTTGTSTKSEVQTKGKTEEEQKKEIISGVKDLVEQYNVIYRNLDELGGSVNTTFLSKLKQLMRNSEDELKKMGVSLNKDGTLSVTAKTLESADLKSLKDTFCKSNGIADKLTDKAKDIENSAASTIQVMNRMYGTQTLYNKYGASGAYYGNNGSWYNALG
ncbi:MAG: hypothetical protein IJN64_03120 [Lachnospiraceae bacterium]|nr:hypothetical protein [Lachnospiraceae bacterium]